MKKIISLVLLSFLFSGCAFFRVHKVDVDQGNIITSEDVGHLHRGMSPMQVKAIMGNPVLVNIFTPNRIGYVYTFQMGYS